MSLVDEFCAFHHNYHSISENRRKLQPPILRAFEDYIDKPWSDLQATDFADFLAFRLEARAPSTVTWEKSCVQPFIKWLWQRKIITADQYLELGQVEPPRGGGPRGQPRPYDRKQIQKLWTELEAQHPLAPDERIRRFKAGIAHYPRVRDHGKRLQLEAIVWLALGGGLRRVEIYNMRLEELHPDNEYLVVRGARKNREAEERLRAVPMFAPTRAALGAWLEWRALLDPPHDFPWLSLHRADTATNRMRWRRYSDIMRTLGSGWQFHRLRHTFGTEMARARMPIERLQEVMGHSNIMQTRQYMKLATDDNISEAGRAESRFVAGLERTRAA